MGGQIMHTKTDERLVYIIGVIGTLAILILNLKSGFSTDSIWAILKDLAPLAVSILIFKGLFHKPDFKKAANRAIAKIRQEYADILAKDIVKCERENAEECLFFAKPQTSFVPLKELREGVLEIRVSYGTLANFGKISPKETAENEAKIADKKSLVKSKVIATLQASGAKFRVSESKDSAVRIEFEKQSGYDKVIINVINEVVCLLKES
jgi:hypothetical protein